MPTKLKRNAKLWLILIAVLFWLAGSGFYPDLSASSDETYPGLKIFSGRRKLRSFQHTMKNIIGNRISLVSAHASPLFDNFQDAHFSSCLF